LVGSLFFFTENGERPQEALPEGDISSLGFIEADHQ